LGRQVAGTGRQAGRKKGGGGGGGRQEGEGQWQAGGREAGGSGRWVVVQRSLQAVCPPRQVNGLLGSIWSGQCSPVRLNPLGCVQPGLPNHFDWFAQPPWHLHSGS